jgi:hypothetical protein
LAHYWIRYLLHLRCETLEGSKDEVNRTIERDITRQYLPILPGFLFWHNQRVIRKNWIGIVLLAITLQCLNLPFAFGGAGENAGSESFPYRRLMPDPVVLPAFHDTIRDNPAALRREEAIGGQALFTPSFGSYGYHELDTGFAWANGKMGAGLLFEANLGNPSSMDGLTAGISGGKKAFSIGASFRIQTFSPFNFSGHLGMLFGKDEGSQFAIVAKDIGPQILGSHLSLGYGFIRPDAFNFGFFLEMPAWNSLSSGIFTVGAASTIYMNRWTFGVLATYGIAVGSVTSASGGYSTGINAEVGFSKWMGDHFNLMIRLNSSLTATLGLTLAWQAP